MAHRPARPETTELLTAKHYVTLLLRILVDRQGRVLQGELEDISIAVPQHFPLHFRGRRGLLRALRLVLAGARNDVADKKP